MATEPHRLTIIGDIGVDLVLGPISGWPRVGTETIMERSELRAGGSAGNAALAVAHLGGHSQLLSVVGNDDLGRWLGEQFRGLGASLAVCDAATTLSVGLIHTCGERNFFTTRGHLEQLSYAVIRSRLLPASGPDAMVLLSGVFLTPALRREYSQLLRELRALGYQVALDTNWPPHDWTPPLRAEVAGWLAQCDHVLLNELEVRSLADCADVNDAMDSLVPLLRKDATLVVKAGPRGAIAVQAGRRYECAAPQAKIFDTIGAGDSFNAGYLLARQNALALPDALRAGCAAAVAIISRFPRSLVAPGNPDPERVLTQGRTGAVS